MTDKKEKITVKYHTILIIFMIGILILTVVGISRYYDKLNTVSESPVESEQSPQIDKNEQDTEG